MQVRSGAVGTSKSKNVCDPEHPLKSYPTVIEVTRSSAETTNVIGAPWDVVPLHSPTLKGADRVNGKSAGVHALARTQDSAMHHAFLDIIRVSACGCRRRLPRAERPAAR